MNHQFKTPILFIIFNRPETTKVVFEAIRQVKPSKLFIAADGPRKNKIGENELCKKTRLITNNINWPCDVKILFRKKNLGCKNSVSSAIDWFFKSVDQGIILEDDCLPDQSFFPFCEQMLELYKDDSRIMHISGNNFQFRRQRGDGDYYFSKMNHIWGWATWKRAWRYYDVNMSSLEQFKKYDYINSIFHEKKHQKKWLDIFEKVKNNEINTWDYQWTYAMWSQNGLSILPNKNLVENLGFNNEATHTKYRNIMIEENKSSSLLINKHPSTIIRDYAADIFYHEIMNPKIIKRVYNKIIKIIK